MAQIGMPPGADSVSGGVPMWRMGEHGPSRILLPFPSGQGTDGEIDQWLAQTRAVARMHTGHNAHDGAYGYQQHQRVKQRLEPPSAPRGAPAPARGAPSARTDGAARGPSSIQNLREMVTTSNLSSSRAGGGAQGGEQRRSSPERFRSHEGVPGFPRGAVTASGRPTRPRYVDAPPADRVQRAQPGSAAREPASARPESASAKAASKKKKGSKPQKKAASGGGKSNEALVKPAIEYADISIYPRRKAGQSGIGSNRPPVVITRQVLEEHFNMPLLSVCKKLVRSCPALLVGATCCVVDRPARRARVARVRRVKCLTLDVSPGPLRDGAEEGLSSTWGVQVALQGDQANRTAAGACDCSVGTHSPRPAKHQRRCGLSVNNIAPSLFAPVVVVLRQAQESRHSIHGGDRRSRKRQHEP